MTEVTPVAPVESAPASQAPKPEAAQAGMGASVAAVAVGVVLFDIAIETVLAGSPIRWSVLFIAAVGLAALALLWTRVGPTTRLVVPLAALVGVIAWAAIRLGAGADPALRLATLALARIAVGLAIVATLAAVGLLFGLTFVRRAWYAGAAFAVVALYALVAFARGALAGAPLAQVLGGAFDWQRLPSWLQGGYLATEFVLPVGLVAGLAVVITALARHTRATWAAAGLVLVIGAFVVQSAEMTRAGRPHMMSMAAGPLLARLSTASPSAGGPSSGGPSVNGPTAPAGAPQPESGTSPQAPASAPAPIPAGLVAVAQPGQPISNKAIEVRVTDVRTAPAIGGQTAREGQEYVIVGTSWKSLVPPQKVNRKKAQDRTAGMGSLGFGGGATAQDKAQDEANTTLEQVPFEMGPLAKHVWLVADGRYAEELDVAGTNATDGHLDADRLRLPAQNAVKSGSLVYEAPANTQTLALLVLDTVNGHLLLPVKGTPPVLVSSLGGASRTNEFVDLALAGASWSQAASPLPGTKTLVVTLRGISRQNAIVDIPFGDFSFLQTDKGCVAQPDIKSPAVTRPLAPMGRFLPFVPSEGQLAFVVPADTQGATLRVRLNGVGPIDLPALGDGSVRMPPVVATHVDGKVLRVHVVGTGAPPAGLSPPREGFEYVSVDYVVENLTAGAGAELQPAPQFALADAKGGKYEPDPASGQLPCRLTGANVVPAGGWRRFSLLYAVPAGQPLTLEYRGFESQGSLKVR
jgi:hypothetical protein